MKHFLILTLLILAVTSMQTLKLPQYFHICNANDPHLAQCIGDAANIVIKRLVTGNEYFNLPSLSEFKIGEVHSPIDSNFRFKLADGIAGKLEDIRYIFSKFDYLTKASSATAFFAELKVNGTYELEGAIENIPVKGKGFANIKFEDVYCRLYWNLTAIEREGIRYANVSGLSVVYDIKSAAYSFDGFSDDDIASGHETIQYLNRNWQILAKLIAPVVMQAFSDVALQIGKAVTPKIPLKDILKY